MSNGDASAARLKRRRSPNDRIDTRAIQDWRGHVSITHTTRYTALSPARFKDFWRDCPQCSARLFLKLKSLTLAGAFNRMKSAITLIVGMSGLIALGGLYTAR